MICRMDSIKDYALELTITMPASHILKNCGKEIIDYFEEAMKEGDVSEMNLLLLEALTGSKLEDALCLEGGSNYDSCLIHNGTPVMSAKTPFY